MRPARERLHADQPRATFVQPDDRLVVDVDAVALDRLAQIAISDRRSSVERRRASSNTSTRPRPRACARASAASAAAIRPAESWAASWVTMPTDAVRCVPWPAANGAANASRTRSAQARAAASPSVEASTRKSSAPKRAARALRGSAPRRRAATSRSTASPAPWPRPVLIVRKPSTSTSISANGPPSRTASSIARRAARRLGRPVSASRIAVASRRSRTRRSSVQSRNATTAPPPSSG